MIQLEICCGNHFWPRPGGHAAHVGHTSLVSCAAIVIAATIATHSVAQTPSFPPIRHGIKAVFGADGNDHGGDLENAGKTMAKAFQDLEADLTRIEFKWAIAEPVRGQYDWTEHDRLINFLNENNIEPMLMLYCAPKWAMRGTPADEQLFIKRGQQNLHTVVWPRRDCLRDFERFCETAARRYRGKAKLFEFWNEPDGMAGPVVLHDKDGKAIDVRYGGDAKEYTYWLKRMTAAVKRGNHDAVVAAGSLCVHDLKFIEAMYAAGCADYCDAISLHPYADDGINVEWIQQVRDVMCQYGDWNKPIWLSEFGWNKGGEYNEKNETWNQAALEHAEIIKKTAPVIESIPYITQAYWFTLNDWNTSETGIDPTGTHGYGLMSLDLKRRPAFDAFKKVIADAPRDQRQDTAPQMSLTPPPHPVDLTDKSFEVIGMRHYPQGNVHKASYRLKTPWNNESTRTSITSIHRQMPADNATPATTIRHEPIAFTVPLPQDPQPTPGIYPASCLCDEEEGLDFLLTIPATAALLHRESSHFIAWNIEVDRMKAGLGWSDTHLVFMCAVTDESHEQPHEGADIWKGDSVQLAIDPERDAVRGSRYDDNDSEFAIALTKDGPTIWRYACPVNSYGGAMPAEWVNVTRVGNETRYSARIPWIEIGVENPQPGQIIGVAVAGCDWNSGKRTVHRFGDGIIGGKEPYRFASIILTGGD